MTPIKGPGAREGLRICSQGMVPGAWLWLSHLRMPKEDAPRGPQEAVDHAFLIGVFIGVFMNLTNFEPLLCSSGYGDG